MNIFSSGSANKSVSVESVDSLAELRGEEHAGSLSPSWRRVESRVEKVRKQVKGAELYSELFINKPNFFRFISSDTTEEELRSIVRGRLCVSHQNQTTTLRQLILLRLLSEAGPQADSGPDLVARSQPPPDGGQDGDGEAEVEGVQGEEDDQQLGRP